MYGFKSSSFLLLRSATAFGAVAGRRNRNRFHRRKCLRQIRTAVLVAICVSAPFLLSAQQAAESAGSSNSTSTPSVSAASPGSASNAATETGSISGTVLDTNGSEVQGARVALISLSGTTRRVARSSSNGEFTFSGLPPGEFKLTVSGNGWGTYTSPQIQLRSGGFKFLSGVVLPLTTTASVSVTANPVTLSQEQVQIAVHQRVLGVFPNFYSSYDWNAPPMLAKQKFQLAMRSATDPVEFAGVAIIAGIEQYNNDFPSWGTGAEGYAKRLGAAYAGSVTSKFISNALLPSVFHQDPRYFYKGKGSARSRALYAISAAFIARGDNGRWEPNYSHIIGSFASGALSNLYYPSSDRGLTLTLANGAVNLADSAGTNLLREFVLKRFTTRKQPASARAQ